jgi:hypothetical protein
VITRSIRSLSAAPAVYEWLANSCHPQLLHVFHDACNLINEDREVLSVVPSSIGNGPFNLVLEDSVSFSDRFQVESQVSIVGNQLLLGELIIDVSGVKCWSPRPSWEELFNNRDRIASQLAGFSDPVSNCPVHLVSALSSALAKEDISASREISSHLAGLGIGLTPAGDDFIMGALYATWMIHPRKTAERLAMEIANQAAPLTTSLSAAWLRSAGKGEAGIRWHVFLNALLCSDQIQIQAAMDKIMSIGATSGTEALSGFMATFHFYMEIEKNHVLPGSI